MQTKNVFSIIKNGFQLRSLLMFFWLVENNQSHFDERLSINTSMTDELSLKFSNESVVHLTSLIEKPRQFSPLFATDFAPEIYCNGLPPFRWKFWDYFRKCAKKQNTEAIKWMYKHTLSNPEKLTLFSANDSKINGVWRVSKGKIICVFDVV